MSDNEAPLFTDAYALSQWLLENLADQNNVLHRRIQNSALDLLENLVLALKNHERFARLEKVDEELIGLRVQLRLAESAGFLTESQLLHCLGLADSIGRQLGGWLRRLNSAS